MQAPKVRFWFSIVGESDAKLCINDIVLATAQYFGMTRLNVVSHRRDPDLVMARQIAYYLAKQMTGNGTPWIGRFMGGKDHSTVIYGIKKIKNLIRTDWTVAYDVAHIEAML